MQDLIEMCKHLKYKFLEMFAAVNSAHHIAKNISMIVNTSKSASPGTFCIVICNRRKVLYFADPLGVSL